MKKNKISKIFGATLVISLMLVNINLNLNTNFSPSISLKGYSALACESMEGMGGSILLMKNCYWEENYWEGERWVHNEYHGCEDEDATCHLI